MCNVTGYTASSCLYNKANCILAYRVNNEQHIPGQFVAQLVALSLKTTGYLFAWCPPPPPPSSCLVLYYIVFACTGLSWFLYVNFQRNAKNHYTVCIFICSIGTSLHNPITYNVTISSEHKWDGFFWLHNHCRRIDPKTPSHSNLLTHCGLMTKYGLMNIDQYWFKTSRIKPNADLSPIKNKRIGNTLQ